MNIRGDNNKKRMATDKEIKTLYYNALLNAEAIGVRTIQSTELKQKVREHLWSIRLRCTDEQLEHCMSEMIQQDRLYRVSENNGEFKIGVVK